MSPRTIVSCGGIANKAQGMASVMRARNALQLDAKASDCFNLWVFSRL
jgi:hypothetical protein